MTVRETRSGIFDHKFTIQTFKYLLACFIPPRKVLLHIIWYIHLHAYVCRLKAALHTIVLSLYLCVELESEFSTINLQSKHSNICLHVSFHPENSFCILFYIYTCMRRCVDLSSISYNSIVPVPVRAARSGIFDHKFTVQTFKCLPTCFIPSIKVLLHIIWYIQFRHVDLKQHFIQYYCPCTCEWS